MAQIVVRQSIPRICRVDSFREEEKANNVFLQPSGWVVGATAVVAIYRPVSGLEGFDDQRIII